MTTDPAVRERIVGAMLALACGDALGAPAEFHEEASVRERWGTLKDMTGGGPWAPGEWTDDTSMALAVAEGILEDPDDPVGPVGERFLQWLQTGPKDVGTTTRAVLTGYRGDWARAASQATPQAREGRSAANGSLMRTLPVALAYPDRERMLRECVRISAMTHWSAEAQICCAVHCLWVTRLLDGEEMRPAWDGALRDARAAADQAPAVPGTPGWTGPDVAELVWPGLAAAPALRRAQLQPDGHYAGRALHCLQAAVWGCLTGSDLEDVLVRIVNMGGETDTIAAVAGGPAGAHWGVGALPARWLDALMDCARIRQAGERLADLRRHHEVYATPGLPAFRFMEAADGVYVGRNPLTARDVDALLRAGITQVLDLREDGEWRGPGRFGAEAIDTLAQRGIARHSLPVHDMGAPSSDTLDAAARWIDGALQGGARVLVHCRAGVERTGSVVTAWYGRARGIGYDDALGAMRARGADLRPLPDQERAARAWLG